MEKYKDEKNIFVIFLAYLIVALVFIPFAVVFVLRFLYKLFNNGKIYSKRT